ncbi:hypothetical protein GQ44DRAFT_765387 [Phaeosphaeriaceae sp. PMI808]|nr:hypothetical protein GQ44DRAFT_765387 [Phaeosphaeriaceae sp. PMI808]
MTSVTRIETQIQRINAVQLTFVLLKLSTQRTHLDEVERLIQLNGNSLDFLRSEKLQLNR